MSKNTRCLENVLSKPRRGAKIDDAVYLASLLHPPIGANSTPVKRHDTHTEN